jgi:hypothetical protein
LALESRRNLNVAHRMKKPAMGTTTAAATRDRVSRGLRQPAFSGAVTGDPCNIGGGAINPPSGVPARL